MDRPWGIARIPWSDLVSTRSIFNPATDARSSGPRPIYLGVGAAAHHHHTDEASKSVHRLAKETAGPPLRSGAAWLPRAWIGVQPRLRNPVRPTRSALAIQQSWRVDLWVIGKEVVQQSFARLRRSSHPSPIRGSSEQMSADILRTSNTKTLPPNMAKGPLGCRAEDAHVSPLPGHDESQTYLATAPRSRWRWVVGGVSNQRWLAHTSTLCSL
jgi:hypothetical protein